ncbi:MAG: hypothetical protein K2W85_17480 [Phycisphaerales bacterium]|nr:hypothetical protein [Phycisphaerales bacterium]
MIVRFAAALISLLVSFATSISPANAQSVLIPCQPGPPNFDPAGWVRTNIAYDVVEDIRFSEVATDKRQSPWAWNTACNCFYSPNCNSNLRRTCLPQTVKTGEKVQRCWEVNGKVSATVAAGVLPGLFAKLGVSVELGGKLSGCTESMDEISLNVAPHDCWAHGVQARWQNRSIRATWEVAETVANWRYFDTINGHNVTAITRCGVQKASASARSLGESVVFLNTVYPPCPGKTVGGVIVIPPLPQGDDRPFSKPCGTPMPPCDDIPTGVLPVCGCIG